MSKQSKLMKRAIHEPDGLTIEELREAFALALAVVAEIKEVARLHGQCFCPLHAPEFFPGVKISSVKVYGPVADPAADEQPEPKPTEKTRRGDPSPN